MKKILDDFYTGHTVASLILASLGGLIYLFFAPQSAPFFILGVLNGWLIFGLMMPKSG